MTGETFCELLERHLKRLHSQAQQMEILKEMDKMKFQAGDPVVVRRSTTVGEIVDHFLDSVSTAWPDGTRFRVRCKTCEWCVHSTVADLAPGNPQGASVMQRYCRRHPQSMTVADGYWCGEWKMPDTWEDLGPDDDKRAWYEDGEGLCFVLERP